VVHVIYNGQEVGIAPNISDAQVQSQITVLNQDFRKMVGTPGYGSTGYKLGVDTQIQFVLAQQDPNGRPTNGIDRVSFVKESWSTTEIENTLKPATIWDPTQYLNLWTVLFTDSTFLGYAQFPEASSLSGISGTGNANTDGVVIKYNAFGSGSGSSFLLKAPYNKGRTTTHEIGHWLGLIHIWGDDSNCNTNTDYCNDTPVSKDPNYGCPTGADSCTTKTGVDMIENYMDYTDDSCMNTFTAGQKARMDAVMTNSPRRKNLKTSDKGNTVLLFANDAEVKFESSSAPISCGTLVNRTTQKIIIYNRGTTNLTSVSGNYTINGGSPISFLWTGSLAPNKFAAFPITIISAVNGTIVVSIDKANGFTDERVTNNSVSVPFTLPSAATNYIFPNYIFKLQQDYYGSETTWNIKNTSGTILYSGGPYTNKTTLPSLITQTWTLPSNQCYTFTINDSGKDGICCGLTNGNGYYKLTSDDGSTVIASGASFTTSESKSFATNTASDITKPTLTSVADRDEYVAGDFKFIIPDYTYLTTATDNSGTVTLTQLPSQGTIISGNGTEQLIKLTAFDSNGNSDFITFKITLKEDITKPTLTSVAEREGYVDDKCEFEIPNYTDLTNATDNSGTIRLTQYPGEGTIISGNEAMHTITLTATDSSGNSDFITFKITLKEKDFSLYPNPAKETINIKTSNCVLPNSYTIANNLGQIVLQKEVSAASDLNIDTSTLSTGIYFITVTKENEKKTLRFIKN
jgi:hypothetical protein